VIEAGRGEVVDLPMLVDRIDTEPAGRGSCATNATPACVGYLTWRDRR
jgi:hypothetical protein